MKYSTPLADNVKEKPLISLRDLDYTYGQHGGARRTALKGISADIFPGDFIAVIGPNGSGKSTLARHLNALLVPSGGKVRVGEMDTTVPENVWKIRSLVGMVFQNPDNQVIAAMVEEDVAFGPENLGVEPSEVRRRVFDVLAKTGLKDMAKRPPHALSGGQKQLLAFAGVLAMQPKCIVLDEPTSMLDPRNRKNIMDLLVKVNREQGVTIVLVTHFMEEAFAANRVWVMDNGKLGQQGSVEEVFSNWKYLEDIGLELPAARRMVKLLSDKGLNLPQREHIFFPEDLVEELCHVL